MEKALCFTLIFQFVYISTFLPILESGMASDGGFSKLQTIRFGADDDSSNKSQALIGKFVSVFEASEECFPKM